MFAQDPFTQGYAQLLDQTYDVVDRIVLRAYFPMGQSPGGFRTWWRRLHNGSDDQLDNVHLQRLAGRFSRRVRGWAKKNGIPVVYCAAKERKCDIAARYQPTDPAFQGIFAVLIGRAPAPVWEVQQRSKRGGLNLRRKKPMPWVNHYYFHIIDKHWGHVTIRLCGQPPFSALVMLNGHEYVACRARKAGIPFIKKGNCFTSSAPELNRAAETLRSKAAVGLLGQVCGRWLPLCVCFGLSFEEQQASGFQYNLSVYQLEYSRNLLFSRGAEMDKVFQEVIDRTRAPLDIKTLKTIFGYKHRPRRRRRSPRFAVAIERPECADYDLTVFKVHFGKLTLKMYTKGERVLRIEAIAHNTDGLRTRKSLHYFGDILRALKSMLERFLETLRGVDASWIADHTLDELPLPGQVGTTKVGGVDINSERMRAVLRTVIALSMAPQGFTSEWVAKVVSGTLQIAYSQRQAAYDIKKLRGKNLVAPAARRPYYRATPEGLRTMAALLILRDHVIKPVLAGAGRSRMGRPPKRRSIIDEHYDRLHKDMRDLFQVVGIAA